MQPEINLETNYYKILNIRNLTESTFVLQLPATRFKFEAGQHISLSVAGDFQSREYSIYSAEDANYLEILIKEVDGGYFTPKLRNLKKGDILEIHGPFGRFTLDKEKLHTHKHIFIASGTGIAPFHSMAKSYPALDYQVIHGVRTGDEAYERETYDAGRYLLCTSRDETGDYHGRLTGYLKETDFGKNSCFYLCGNSDMIFDAMEILKSRGFGRKDINVEVYF